MQTNHSKSKELLLRPNKQEMSGSSYTRKKIELAKVWTTWKDLFIKFCDCWNGVFYKLFNIVILPRFYKTTFSLESLRLKSTNPQPIPVFPLYLH